MARWAGDAFGIGIGPLTPSSIGDIIGLQGGGFLLGWTGSAVTGTQTDAAVLRLGANGRPQGEAVQLTATANRLEADLSLTSLPDGGAAVAWEAFDCTAGTSPVLAAVLNASGQLASDEETVSVNVRAVNFGDPSLARVEGGFRVYHFTSPAFGDNDLRRVSFAADGTPGAARVIDATTPQVTSIPPLRDIDSATLTNGAVAVVAHAVGTGGAASGGALLWIDDARGEVSDPIRFDLWGQNLASSNGITQPRVAALASGDILALWNQSNIPVNGGTGIFFRRLDADGQAVGDRVKVADGFDAEVVALPGGGWLVAWTWLGVNTGLGTPIGVSAQEFGPTGARVGGVVELSAPAPNGARLDGLALGADGRVIAVMAPAGAIETLRAQMLRTDGPAAFAGWTEGTAGRDRLAGTRQDDMIAAFGGADRVSGGAGSDDLRAGAGNDTLFGGRGDDILDGGAGNDRTFGGSGNDVLVAKGGFDTLEGGGGADTFVFRAPFGGAVDGPLGTVLDYTPGVDRIVVTGVRFDGIPIPFEVADGGVWIIDASAGLPRRVAFIAGIDGFYANEVIFA